MTACGSVAQRIRCQPHGQIRTKSRIAEIQLRRLTQPFEFIVWIRRKKIDYIQSDKNFQPLFCGARCDVGRFSQRWIIDLLRNKRCAAYKKFAKTNGVRNASRFGGIAHKVCVNIGIEILLSQFVIHTLYLGHTALPNVIEHLNHIVFRKPALSWL